MQTTTPEGTVEALTLSAARKDITVTADGPGTWRLVGRTGRSAAIWPHPRSGYVVKVMGDKNGPNRTEVLEKCYGDFGAISYALGQLRAAAWQDI